MPTDPVSDGPDAPDGVGSVVPGDDPGPGPGPVPGPGPGAEAADACLCQLAAGQGDVRTGSRLPADAELAELVAAMGMADRAMARVVNLAGRLDARKAAREEGMTVDGALRLHTGATRGDVSTVLTVAEVLASMPITANLFDRGTFTWGHIRALAVQTRRMTVTSRSELDRYLGSHAARLDGLDTDGRLAAIDDAVAQHTDPDRIADRTERTVANNVAILTPRLDGTGSLYTDLDPESFATVADRLHTEADAPLASPSPGDDATGLPRYTIDRPSRGRQLAEALVRIFSRHGSRGGSAVRFTVIVDVDRVTDQVAGTIAAAAANRPPRVVRRALDRLACDAALDVVIRDGVDLLAAKRYRPEVTAATRRAVEARDRGCRFPSCRAPAAWCDIHHVVERAAGGDHAVTNLILLCRAHHTIVHRRGWDQQLEVDGTYRITRRGRSWITLPRIDHQLPPPPKPGPEPLGQVPAATVHPRPAPPTTESTDPPSGATRGATGALPF